MQSRPTVINLTHGKTTNLCDEKWMCVCVHSPKVMDDYSQWYLALLIPDSRLNTRNALGTRTYVYCKKKFIDRKKSRKFNTTKFFLCKLFSTWKFPDLWCYSIAMIQPGNCLPFCIFKQMQHYYPCFYKLINFPYTHTMHSSPEVYCLSIGPLGYIRQVGCVWFIHPLSSIVLI